MVVEKKEHVVWVGYGLKAHLQWDSLFVWDTTQGITLLLLYADK